jgi:RNA-directed DNA polymerase
MVKLVYATDTKIKRHRKIKAEANPYDPIWEPYFEERLALRMGTELLGNQKAWRLWQTQEGNCPECGEIITPETGWHVHHVMYRVYGARTSCPTYGFCIRIAIESCITKTRYHRCRVHLS